jgi:hypothetical protein
LRALYDNLETILPRQASEAQAPYLGVSAPDMRVQAAQTLDAAIRAVLQDGWRENPFKTKRVRHAIRESLAPYGVDDAQTDKILEIVRNQRDY